MMGIKKGWLLLHFLFFLPNFITEVNNYSIEISNILIKKSNNSHNNKVDIKYNNLIFTNVYCKFKKFNKNIDTTIVELFINVSKHYKLDTNFRNFNLYIGQILLESGAKQYNINGGILESSAGAIGMCQIMPSTCVWYMEKYMNSKDILEFKNLGALDFSFIYKHNLSNEDKIKLVKNWLSDVKNNIIMWGFITKTTLNKGITVYEQLISYNAGIGGMKKYISNGGNCLKHNYIVGIKNKLAVASE